jgi:hypothetical protein
MGMFDCVQILWEGAPDTIDKKFQYQTKSMPGYPSMTSYLILENGMLGYKQVQIDYVPEEERPRFGTPEWDTIPFARMEGMCRLTEIGIVTLQNFNGTIFFYAGDSQQFVAHFVNGCVQEIADAND